MTKDQITNMQQQIKQQYPLVNKWGCWLFAYVFSSRVWGEIIRLSTKENDTHWRYDIDEEQEDVQSLHFIISYDWMYFDWLEFRIKNWNEYKCTDKGYTMYEIETFSKEQICVSVLEWDRNTKFFQDTPWYSIWDTIRNFIYDLESILLKTKTNIKSFIR